MRRIHPRKRLRLGGTLEDYRKKVEKGEYQMHAFPLGTIITQIQVIEGERVLVILLLGGEKFAAWKDECLERLSRFAIENGCVALEALCRLGLESELKSLGAQKIRVLMRKELRQ